MGCDDANPCTDDSCDPAFGCSWTPNTAPCNEGTCSNGVCVANGGGENNCQADTTVGCEDIFFTSLVIQEGSDGLFIEIAVDALGPGFVYISFDPGVDPIQATLYEGIGPSCGPAMAQPAFDLSNGVVSGNLSNPGVIQILLNAPDYTAGDLLDVEVELFCDA